MLRAEKEEIKSGKLNINHLTEVANGDENFKKDMIVIFQKSIVEGLTKIEAFCKEHQWLKAADAAHKIMPPCKHFEADELYLNLKYFEDLRDTNPDLSIIELKLNELKANVEIVNNELKLYL